MINMTNDFKIEDYKKLMGCMRILTDYMPEIIFKNYYDENKYLYSLYFEAFNSIRGFCVLLGTGALIPQACTILRTAIERISTTHVIEMHPDLLDNYIKHQQIRYEVRNLENKDKKIRIDAEFKDNKYYSSKKYNDFLEYGWLGSLSNKYNFDELIRCSKIQNDDTLVEWKNEFNQWTHSSVVYANLFNKEDCYNSLKYAHVLIDIAAELLDYLCVDFYKRTGFGFVIDGYDYFSMFRDLYENVIEN